MLLVRAGADASLTNRKRENAREAAVRGERWDAAEVIEQAGRIQEAMRVELGVELGVEEDYVHVDHVESDHVDQDQDQDHVEADPDPDPDHVVDGVGNVELDDESAHESAHESAQDNDSDDDADTTTTNVDPSSTTTTTTTTTLPINLNEEREEGGIVKDAPRAFSDFYLNN